MPKYAYRNVSDTFFHAFVAFDSISKHFHYTNRSPGPPDQVVPKVDQLKSTMLLNSLC